MPVSNLPWRKTASLPVRYEHRSSNTKSRGSTYTTNELSTLMNVWRSDFDCLRFIGCNEVADRAARAS